MNQIGYIFEFLDFSHVVRLSHVCTQFNILYNKYLTLRSNEWIIIQVDKYIRNGQIISAERLMRYYICLNDISGSRDNLRKRNKFAVDKINNSPNNAINNKVISKYISLICIYIWNSQLYNNLIHRTEIYKSFRSRVHSNINNYNIYIPINLYGGSISVENTYIPKNKTFLSKHDKSKHDKSKHNKSDIYIIASIFAYICVMDRQFKLAYDLINIITKNNSSICRKNKVYYLVKWQLTQNNKYLKIFENSDFAFGMYLYGYMLYKTDSNGTHKFISILEQCLELDPTLIIALNSYINLKSRIDLIMTSIESHPMYIPSYILSIKLLFDTSIWGNNTILDKIDDFISKNVYKYTMYTSNIKSDLEQFDGIKTLKHSSVFINIHRLLYLNTSIPNCKCYERRGNNSLIIENLVLLYRFYIRNDRMGNEAVNILLYIQNNYNIDIHIKNYIYQQLQILTP